MGKFHSFSGVRQGENLSPVQFLLYLNDLEAHLLYNINTGLTIDCDNIDITVYLRLIVLLYADDTVILATSRKHAYIILTPLNPIYI